MTDGLLKLIMKHPIAFLISSMLLMTIFPLGIFILKFKSMIALGLPAIIFFGVAMGCFPMTIWWLLTYIIYRDSFYKKVNKSTNTTEYNIEVIKFPFVILVGSSSSIIFCTLTLFICYIIDCTFRTFLFWCLIIPILRFILYMLVERKVFKTDGFQQFLNDIKFDKS